MNYYIPVGIANARPLQDGGADGLGFEVLTAL
jgi:hypothetical protein